MFSRTKKNKHYDHHIFFLFFVNFAIVLFQFLVALKCSWFAQIGLFNIYCLICGCFMIWNTGNLTCYIFVCLKSSWSSFSVCFIMSSKRHANCIYFYTLNMSAPLKVSNTFEIHAHYHSWREFDLKMITTV